MKKEKNNTEKKEVKHARLEDRMKKQIVENDPLKKKGIMKDQSKGYRK